MSQIIIDKDDFRSNYIDPLIALIGGVEDGWSDTAIEELEVIIENAKALAE